MISRMYRGDMSSSYSRETVASNSLLAFVSRPVQYAGSDLDITGPGLLGMAIAIGPFTNGEGHTTLRCDNVHIRAADETESVPGLVFLSNGTDRNMFYNSSYPSSSFAPPTQANSSSLRDQGDSDNGHDHLVFMRADASKHHKTGKVESSYGKRWRERTV